MSRIEHIQADVLSEMVCSNLNRVAILHLLRKTRKNEMQAEEISCRLGLSHRTILYHLDILHDYGLVEVRKFRKKGNRLMRSVWGLKPGSGLKKVFYKITRDFDPAKLESRVCNNVLRS